MTTGSSFGNGYIVVLGRSGDIFSYSSDGVAWIKGTPPSSAQFYEGITFGNGMFFTTNSSETIYMAPFSSSGSHSWTAPSNNLVSSGHSSGGYYDNRFAFGNGKFVVSDYTSGVAYSLDGVSWNYNSSLFRSYSSSTGSDQIAYGNQKFIFLHINGYLATSTDGISWNWVGSSSTNPVAIATGQSSG